MIRITPVNPFADLIALLDAFAQPTRAMQNRIGDQVRRGIGQNFSRQSAAGAPWQQLAPSTQRDRQRRGYNPTYPILIRGGKYVRSFTSPYDDDHVQDFLPTSTGWALEVGSDDYRGRWLEFGVTKNNLPARPALTLSDEAEANIGNEIDRIFTELEARFIR